MLAHRLRRWPNINPTLVQCLCVCWDVGLFSFESQNAVTAKMSSYWSKALWGSIFLHWAAQGRQLGVFPANTRHCPIVGSMLVQRRWPNIEPTMGQYIALAVLWSYGALSCFITLVLLNMGESSMNPWGARHSYFLSFYSVLLADKSRNVRLKIKIYF